MGNFDFQEWLIVGLVAVAFLRDYISPVLRAIGQKFFGIEIKEESTAFEAEIRTTLKTLADRLSKHLDDEDTKNIEYNKTIREVCERLAIIEEHITHGKKG